LYIVHGLAEYERWIEAATHLLLNDLILGDGGLDVLTIVVDGLVDLANEFHKVLGGHFFLLMVDRILFIRHHIVHVTRTGSVDSAVVGRRERDGRGCGLAELGVRSVKGHRWHGRLPGATLAKRLLLLLPMWQQPFLLE